MVVFSDYQCPACRILNEELEVRRRDGSLNFAVAFRHWPLSMHKFAEQAAVASECAGAQGRFPQMHDTLFSNQRDLGRVSWQQFAQMAGVPDSMSFVACLANDSVLTAVRDDARIAQTLRSRGTPTVVVQGGVRFVGVPAKGVLDSLVATLSEQNPPIQPRR